MKVAGIIAEFNPLHKGHEYIIKKIKEDNVDLLIAAMSPNFVMRGEPAIFNKFTRCEHALKAGIDIVLEIPTIYTIESADIYAKAGTTILSNAGVTDLYFGSEIEDINIFNKVIEIESNDDFKNELKKLMKEGNSFNTSYKKAITSLEPSLNEYLNNPNFLLGLEYIKAIKSLNLNMNVHIIKRIETGYYSDIDSTKEIQSASAIRKEITEGKSTQYLSYEFENDSIHVKNDYFNLIKYKLDSSSLDELREINGVTEGIESLLKKTSKASSFDEMYEILISRRNRETKINRILFSLLLNIKKSELKEPLNYIRVLGFNNSSKYLKEIKSVPVYTTINRDTDKRVLREIDFTRIYDNKSEDLERKEYKPIIL